MTAYYMREQVTFRSHYVGGFVTGYNFLRGSNYGNIRLKLLSIANYERNSEMH